jgi:hypothetical protein
MTLPVYFIIDLYAVVVEIFSGGGIVAVFYFVLGNTLYGEKKKAYTDA